MNLKPNELFQDLKRGKTYRIDKKLGQGSYGVVYLVEEQPTKLKFALKVQQSITQQERSLLESFVKRKFSNLVNTISYGQYQNRYPYSIMEYCQENLYEIITNKGTITNEQFRYVAHQIATGLKELHELGLIHRDIKPENIMQFDHVDQQTKKVQKTYKICDFGLVMQQELAKTQFSGTPYYLAPEQLNKEEKNYTNKVDIWALGVVFYELVTGWPLFQGRNQEEICGFIRDANIQDKIQKLNLNLEYKLMIIDMLKKDPKNRPDIFEVIKRLLPIIRSVSVKPSQQQQQQQYRQPQSQSFHDQNPNGPEIKIAATYQQKRYKGTQIDNNINNIKNTQNMIDQLNKEKQNASPEQKNSSVIIKQKQQFGNKISYFVQKQKIQIQNQNRYNNFQNDDCKLQQQQQEYCQQNKQIKPTPPKNAEITIISKQNNYSALQRQK